MAIFAACSGQIWTAERSGGSALRDSFASVLMHRAKRSQARMLLPTEEAQRVERLETGRAILWRTSGATNVLQIPNTTGADVRRVAGLLEANAPTMHRLTPAYSDERNDATYKPEISQESAEGARLTSAPASGKSVSPEAVRAAALFLGGMRKPADLVRELRGVTTNQGAKYQQALAEVMDLLAEGIQAQR